MGEPAMSRRVVLAAVALALVIVAAAVGAAAVLRPAATALPRLPGASASVASGAHTLPFGPVRPPRALPDVALRMDDGSERRLGEFLKGRFTYVQLMFAGCSTTCPLQGAIFADVRRRIAAEGAQAQLLSISVDALGDGPRELSAWLAHFGTDGSWRAGVPALGDLGLVLDALQGRGQDYDLHDARAYMIDPDGRLVFATEDLPSPDALVSLLREAEAARLEERGARPDG